MLCASVLCGSVLCSCVLGGSLLIRQAQAAGFGRWETSLQECSVKADGQRHRPCLRLRLEQNLGGFLNVRFLGAGEGGPLASTEMVFAGTLTDAQGPLRCDRDGRCKAPDQPLRVKVGVVAWRSFDGRGLVDKLPLSRLARGECLIGQSDVQCNARLNGSTHWAAQAKLRQPATP